MAVLETIGNNITKRQELAKKLPAADLFQWVHAKAAIHHLTQGAK